MFFNTCSVRQKAGVRVNGKCGIFHSGEAARSLVGLTGCMVRKPARVIRIIKTNFSDFVGAGFCVRIEDLRKFHKF